MRLIQVGLGGFGRSWATLVQATPGVTLAAVVDSAPAALDWAQTNLGLPAGSCFASLADALARVPSEAALIVTPPETHTDLAIAALEAGRHVLVEKPLAPSLPEARRVVEHAARVGQTLMVGQNYRFRAGPRAAQRVIADGAIGSLISVRLTFRRDTRSLFPPGNFRYRMRHPLLVDMAIHHLDLIRAVTGQDIVRVAARSWPVPDSPYRHHPAAAIVFTLSGGAAGLYDGDWAALADETPWEGSWELLGDAGRMLWRGGAAGDIAVQRWGGALESVPVPPLEAEDRAGVLQAFLTAIETGREPETSGRDHLKSLAAVLASVEAAETGETITVRTNNTATVLPEK